MTDLLIKPEPDLAGAPSPAIPEDALYEDTHDELEFTSDANMRSAMLARIPRELWETWSSLPDTGEIRVGTVRVQREEEVGGVGNGKTRIRMHMLLNPELAQHQILPQEYEFDVMNEHTQNVYLFTEQNVPGYKKGSYERDRENNIPAKLRTRDKPFGESGVKVEGAGGGGVDLKKRKAGDYRKPVPKKTCLAGKIKSEWNILANDDEVERALIRRMRQVKSNAPRTIYQNSLITTSMLGSLDRFSNFVRTDQPTGPTKPQTLKAARMPLNELRDAIFACFRRYKYWSMKALRNTLQQPEAYLRESLDGMATLARSGAFTGNWYLKPESSGYVEGGLDELAPVKEEEGPGRGGEASELGEGDDDDGDVDFEDVPPR